MKYIVKKGLTLIGTLLLVSFITFLLFQIVPGDPVTSILGTEYTPEKAQDMREELGLNESIPKRYVNWLAELAKGDLGTSYKYKIPVSKLLKEKIPVTLWLAVISFVIIVVVSIPISVIAAKYGKSKMSRAFDIFNQSVMAIPSFFLGIMIIIIFGLIFKTFTPGRYIDYRTNFVGFILYIIPAAVAVAIPKIAILVKYLKASFMKEMNADYVRTALSKGASERRVLYYHIFRNGLMPAITMLGMIVAEIMAGSIVVEQVFNLPGLGVILVSSVSNRDFPVVQAIVVYIAFMVIICNCIVDVAYHLIDPRVKGV